VLADLLEDGVEREKAYRVVQAAAARTAATGQHFAATLAEEGIDGGRLEPARFLGHHDVVFDRLKELR
jgi:adenylosuccinate lyase